MYVTIMEFARLLKVHRSQVHKNKESLPLDATGKRINIVKFCDDNNINLKHLSDGKYYTKRELKRETDLETNYEFEKLFSYQNQQPAFRFGGSNYYYRED